MFKKPLDDLSFVTLSICGIILLEVASEDGAL